MNMKMKTLAGAGFFAGLFALYGCGSSSTSTTNSTPTAAAVTGGLVDESGQTITSVDTNDSVNLTLSNLTANSQYSITVTDPSGVSLSPSGGFIATSDEDGNIASSTIVQDLSTNSVSVPALVLKGAPFTPKKVDTGTYTITANNSSGTQVFTTSLTVTDGSKVFCADSAGTARASFAPSQTVYAEVKKGSGTLADGTYTCYVLSDLNANLADQDTLAGTSVTVTVASGEGLATLGAAFAVGAYDVICDIDGDGKYDKGSDLISRAERFRPCFTVQSLNSGSDIIGQVCSDRHGNYRDFFDPNATDQSIRDVFAWISPAELSLVEHAISVNKYVVAHQDTWSNGDTLTDVDSAIEKDPVQGFCTNESPWLVWPRQNLRPGCYDCVIDVNSNGRYDKGTDFVDNIDNSGDNTVGGMCVTDNTSACTDFITISSHTEGQSVDATAVTLAGTLAQAGTAGKVIVTSGSSSNTINLDVSSTSFSANIPLFNGDNQITISVTKSNGTTICGKTIKLTSTSTSSSNQLFRAQLTWDGDTDMDLHVVKPGGAYSNGGSGTTDCNFANCAVGLDGSGSNTIDWGTAGSEADDAKLDVDCIACGNGIENIWMNAINEDGDYKVYVDAFSGDETAVDVTIFINGASVRTVSCGAMSSGAATDSCFVGTISWTGGSSGNGTFTASGTKASTF